MNPVRHSGLGRLLMGVACGLFLMGATACGSLQAMTAKPDLRNVSVQVVRLDLRKADLRIDVQIANNASAPLTIAGYDYDLKIDGHPFLNGVSDTAVELSPQTVTTVQIPVSIDLADLFKKLHAIKWESDLPYRFAATLRIQTPLGVRSLSFQKDGLLQPLLR